MLLQASSVCGLFKWRQFEPVVILLARGWVSALFIVLSYDATSDADLELKVERLRDPDRLAGAS